MTPTSLIYNIEKSNPKNLLDFVDIPQQEFVRTEVSKDYDIEAHKELVSMQAGDVSGTYADTSVLERDFGFKPGTSLKRDFDGLLNGVKNFIRYKASIL